MFDKHRNLNLFYREYFFPMGLLQLCIEVQLEGEKKHQLSGEKDAWLSLSFKYIITCRYDKVSTHILYEKEPIMIKYHEGYKVQWAA